MAKLWTKSYMIRVTISLALKSIISVNYRECVYLRKIRSCKIYWSFFIPGNDGNIAISASPYPTGSVKKTTTKKRMKCTENYSSLHNESPKKKM